MSVPPVLRILAVCGTVLATSWACDLGGGAGSGGVGAPCNTSDDCEGDLACDFHGDKGSCQVDHGHESSSESESESNSSTTSTGTTGTAESSSTTTTTESSSETTAGPTTSESETESDTGSESSTGEPGTTGDETELCEALCACMLLNCSTFDAYPYADTEACMTACETLDAPTLQCYGGFCEDAAIETEPGLTEHWCEHAWGELATEKC